MNAYLSFSTGRLPWVGEGSTGDSGSSCSISPVRRGYGATGTSIRRSRRAISWPSFGGKQTVKTLVGVHLQFYSMKRMKGTRGYSTSILNSNSSSLCKGYQTKSNDTPRKKESKVSYSNINCLTLFYAAYLLEFALVDAVLYLGPVVLLPPLVDGEPPAVGVHRDPRGRDHRFSLARHQRVDLRYTAPNSLISVTLLEI